MLIHILGHLHLGLQFLEVLDVDVVLPLRNLLLLLLLLLHFILPRLIIRISFKICLVGLQLLIIYTSVIRRHFLVRPIVFLNAFWSVFWHAHFLVAPLELLLVVLALRRPRRTHPKRAADEIGVGCAVLRGLAGLDTAQILIYFSIHVVVVRLWRNSLIVVVLGDVLRALTLLRQSFLRLHGVVVLKAQMAVAADFGGHRVAVADAAAR